MNLFFYTSIDNKHPEQSHRSPDMQAFVPVSISPFVFVRKYLYHHLNSLLYLALKSDDMTHLINLNN